MRMFRSFKVYISYTWDSKYIESPSIKYLHRCSCARTDILRTPFVWIWSHQVNSYIAGFMFCLQVDVETFRGTFIVNTYPPIPKDINEYTSFVILSWVRSVSIIFPFKSFLTNSSCLLNLTLSVYAMVRNNLLFFFSWVVDNREVLNNKNKNSRLIESY